jgi:hypothetical protein
MFQTAKDSGEVNGNHHGNEEDDEEDDYLEEEDEKKIAFVNITAENLQEVKNSLFSPSYFNHKGMFLSLCKLL